jgi:hypothetical protein
MAQIIQTVNPPVICTDQTTVKPVITCVEGAPNLKKMQAVTVVTGQAALIEYTMRDGNGDPVDLRPCLQAGGTVELRLREAVIGMYPGQPGVIIPCTLPDPPGDGSDGRVLAQLTQKAVAFPGISRADFGMLDAAGHLLFNNEIFLVVNRSQYGEPAGVAPWPFGPPTIPEIRLHLRDSAPEDNLWLGVQEFDLAELAACIERPIHYFNESPPPIYQIFSTANFPARHHYLEAIIGCLYQMASLHYARVHLPYQQQQGLTVDDKKKAEQYAAIGKEKWEEWKNWVRHKKIQFNATASFQSIGSPYYGNLWWNT